ncbi:Uncharacterized protein dnl_13000 [Desulfonema limicola]|uniref:Uncharacterized protein n=1 Tax=Desulfonema limicola TaxID=45656 RepID=A0A975B585_9BACT|nr:hypothetical protein [Desulfonema limicola]QTA79051.1 Uncharacterized protein dnl_13000 [Desulfonema limicola]
MIFKGKLDSAKKYIETHKSAVIETNIIKETPETIEPNKIKLTIASKDGFSDRIFEVTDSLSQNAQIMENLLNNTVESIERSLNDQEKMYVFYRFVKKNIFGESP